MARTLDLGYRQTIYIFANRSLDIAHGHREGPVDTHYDVCARFPHSPRRIADQRACAVLLGLRDAVLEIELYAIGAAGVCLVDVFFDVDRDVEQRAPNRLPWGTIRCQD